MPFRSHASKSKPRAAGAPPNLADTVVWTREVTPRERYRILYVDRDGQTSSREIELVRLGHVPNDRFGPTPYLGVTHLGRFKTLRLDRIRAAEPLEQGGVHSLRVLPQYGDDLPVHPKPGIVRVPTTRGGARIARTWAVDLALYTCTCPERRVRSSYGYAPGQLGACCLHIARAILDHLPPNSPGWTPELLAFLADRNKLHLDNLS